MPFLDFFPLLWIPSFRVVPSRFIAWRFNIGGEHTGGLHFGGLLVFEQVVTCPDELPFILIEAAYWFFYTPRLVIATAPSLELALVFVINVFCKGHCILLLAHVVVLGGF